MLNALLWCVGVALLLFWAVRRFESSNLYFPTRRIDATPRSIGLDYQPLSVSLSDGTRVAGWIVAAPESRGTLLFCHGNAGNISHRLESIRTFHEMNLTVAIFDYPGYGESTGRPHERNLYASARAVYDLLSMSLSPNQIVLFGRSLGAAVAVHLASEVPAAGLIAESAFTNTVDIGRDAFPFLPVKLLVRQHFDSISKIAAVTMPTIIIHSRQDEIIPYKHGVRLFEFATEPKTFLEISGGHNDGYLVSGERYLQGMKAFLDNVLPQNTEENL